MFLLFLVLLFHEIDKSVVERLISVGASKETDSASVLDELQEILVINDGLPSNIVIHRSQRERIDLLHDGVRLLFGVPTTFFTLGVVKLVLIRVLRVRFVDGSAFKS